MEAKTNTSLTKKMRDADEAVGAMKSPGKVAVGAAKVADSASDWAEAGEKQLQTWSSTVERLKWVMDVVDGIAEVCAVSTPWWFFSQT